MTGGDLWMCAEDLGTRIWSHFNPLNRHNQELIHIKDCSPDLLGILVDCLPFNDYGENLTDALSNSVRLISQEFILGERIIFELQAGWDKSAKLPRLGAAALTDIYSRSFLRFGRWAFQIVPASEIEVGSKRLLNRLDVARLFEFRPPRKWRRLLVKIRTELPAIGYSEQQWLAGIRKQKFPEDFKKAKLAYAIQKARITSDIGWNARSLFHDYIADFHWTTRELHWLRFCIDIRDEILAKFQEIFAVVGSWLGEKPKLVWDRLPNIRDVDGAEARIMGKGASFNEILESLKTDKFDSERS